MVQACFHELFRLGWTSLDSCNIHLTWCLVYGTAFVAALWQPDLWGRKDPAQRSMSQFFTDPA